MLPKEYGSDSTCHRRFQEWMCLKYLKNYGLGYWKFMMILEALEWKWLSLDSISIKAPLIGGT